MAKRGYKLQEFVAHSANVNCIKIGKKTHRNFITGGDDEKVNLWSIGKPSAITSLSGHTSPIESVAFDSTEVFVAAGASSGVIKLWDLEEIKVVRTLNGHRSYCTAVEFHPFGEFFASGSMDTNLKIWDIRKKGCIHTYKGHRRAVSTIRFSPDGRWVVSGGLDNVVKIWDLTAGKLLHEFKFHEGHIRSMEFHPLEFLLATGSSDRTVKFWDLETFELIGSTRPEATGVRSITFHPDGRTLFCGLDSSLKVYSWEPVVCHDAVDMGWSTLGDLCIDDGKLLGCSYYQNSVAVWVADTSHIEQHGHNILAEDAHVQPKINLREGLTERVGNPRRPTNTMSPDDDPKDIKNIYVDSVTPVASRKTGSLPTVVNLPDPKEIDDLSTRKQVPASKIIGQADGNSFFMPVIVPHDNSAKDSAKSRTESIVHEQDTAAALKPPHRCRPSTTKLDIEGLSVAVESGLKSGTDTAAATNFQKRLVADAAAKDSFKEKAPTSTGVVKEFQKASSPSILPQENRDGSVDSNEESKSVKYVNGVAVVHGRTRSLVERFEKREKLNTDECQTPDLAPHISSNTDKPALMVKPTLNVVPCAIPEAKTSPVCAKTPDVVPFEEPKAKTSRMQVKIPDVVPRKETEPKTSQMPVKPREEPELKTSQMPVKAPDVVPREEPEPKTSQMPVKTPNVVPHEEPEPKTSQIPVNPREEPELKTSQMPVKAPDVVTSQMPVKAPDVVPCPVPEAKTFTVPEKRPNVVSIAATEAKSSSTVQKPDSGPNIKSEEANSSPALVIQRPRTAPSMLPEKGKASPMQRSASTRRLFPDKVRSSPMMVARRSTASSRIIPERTKTSPMLVVQRHDTPNRMIPEKAKSSPLLDDSPQTTGRGLTSKKEDDVADELMLNHDAFLSSLRSRLTKLQVVRHFWERNDARGAINALRKLPDHAVHADVVNVLTDRMEFFTLDLFASLLPVLLDLLDSNTERHISVSLELLLKLVAVFGPVVSSTISAPPTVGVDLHAEKRLESCNQCHIQLQKINKCLPAIIRRGGLPARCAQELNVILQQS
ncbi:katanin p80 WD40 repeat-containing subunit B1-like isoform X2 [Cynara cardunculus var. scolymus]|uniref:katanin p80 WD40 repeat-containing subunit B1-like isoform X2 n=1 Tax=Cynara cardunculus var. scolymus TaxID=59895 RepID=UPI000D625453|nr:katanin p80 WD40 repeat-containing subunit B1-like isoform X2 [Cynara cardunculus var. scolymus]